MRSCQIVILLKYKRQSDFLSYNIHFFGCSTDSFSVVSKEKWNQVSLRRVSQQMPNISSCKMSLVAAPQWRHGWDSTQLENKTQHQQRREERAFKAEETLRASGLLSLQCISGESLISPCSEFNSLCRAKIVTWKKNIQSHLNTYRAWKPSVLPQQLIPLHLQLYCQVQTGAKLRWTHQFSSRQLAGHWLFPNGVRAWKVQSFFSPLILQNWNKRIQNIIQCTCPPLLQAHTLLHWMMLIYCPDSGRQRLCSWPSHPPWVYCWALGTSSTECEVI